MELLPGGYKKEYEELWNAIKQIPIIRLFFIALLIVIIIFCIMYVFLYNY